MSHNNSVPPHPFQDVPCSFNPPPNNGTCVTFGRGHRVHHIQARLASEQGWGWRDAIITEVNGHLARAQYLDGSAEPRLWHHRPLDDIIRVGEPCRIIESGGLIQIGQALICIQVADGAGAVPAPTDPDEIRAWKQRAVPTIVNLGTGEGISVIHGEDLKRQLRNE